MMKATSAAVDLLLWAWHSMKMYEEVTAIVDTVSFGAGNAHQFLNFEFLQFEKCSQDGHVPDDAQLWSVVIAAVGGCVGMMAVAEPSEIPWRMCCGTKKCVSCEQTGKTYCKWSECIFQELSPKKRNNETRSKFALE
jgi:hypothetical protein